MPGAFTPTCQEQHIVTYTAQLSKLKAKGVDQVVVISINDAWVMSAWGKSNGVTDDSIVCCIFPTPSAPPTSKNAAIPTGQAAWPSVDIMLNMKL